MLLFCTAISRDSVSLFRCPLRSHFQVFLGAISVVFRLRYPYSCFYSYFCFLVFDVFLFVIILFMLLLAVVIISSFTLFNVFLESRYCCIYARPNASKSSSSFFS